MIDKNMASQQWHQFIFSSRSPPASMIMGFHDITSTMASFIAMDSSARPLPLVQLILLILNKLIPCHSLTWVDPKKGNPPFTTGQLAPFIYSSFKTEFQYVDKSTKHTGPPIHSLGCYMTKTILTRSNIERARQHNQKCGLFTIHSSDNSKWLWEETHHPSNWNDTLLFPSTCHAILISLKVRIKKCTIL